MPWDQVPGHQGKFCCPVCMLKVSRGWVSGDAAGGNKPLHQFGQRTSFPGVVHLHQQWCWPEQQRGKYMSRLGTALVAVVFATGAAAGTPAWADRDNNHGYPVSQHRKGGHGHRDHGDGGWIVGLGLLAGAVFLMAASESRPEVNPPSVPVYMPPPAYSSPPGEGYSTGYPPPAPPAPVYVTPSTNSWWYYCNQPAGYYPYVKQCPSGWARVSPTPPG